MILDDLMKPANSAIETCAEWIGNSRRIVVLTGAGISTEAGIPDFRGPNGLYTTMKVDPDIVFEIGHFQEEPGYFYRFAREFVETLQTIQPTFTHRFLARLERDGKLSGIVTQNIDGLHRKAGSERVIELHGSFGSAVCVDCGNRRTGLTAEWWIESMTEGALPPVVDCSLCGGTLKPDVVFFGEQVPRMPEAENLVRSADLFLALGTSLTVYPAAALPCQARCPIVVVNLGGAAIDPTRNHLVVDGSLDTFFQSIAKTLGIFPDEKATA
jgi:NAD-dependent deacetylase